MSKHKRRTAALLPATLMAVFALLCAQATAATTSPLPASEYSVSAVCPPPAPGHAACLALRLVPRSREARTDTHPLGVTGAATPAAGPAAAGEDGYTPADLHNAYKLPDTTEASATQTIALIDAYNDLSAESDLATYDAEFGLPPCTTQNKCFKQVNEHGEADHLPFPESEQRLTEEQALCEAEQEEACYLLEEADSWAVEISLDIETVHAICQNCHVVLVEADSTEFAALEAAEEAAVQLGATEISNSWAGPECVAGECVSDSAAFNHPGTVITAAAGDDGYLNWLEEPRTAAANYPASSPHVVAVGGTRLLLTKAGGWERESVWNDGGESGGIKDGHGAGGGACSTQFTAPPWQQSVADWSSVGCVKKRAIADVSADADPYTGIAVYDSQGLGYGEEWGAIGGTSLASPLIAATYALAGGADGVSYPARTLYENAAKSPTSLHDVTEGSNGECLLPFDEPTRSTRCTSTAEAKTSCSSELICRAAAGYDGPTGVGTPDGISAFQPPAGASEEEGSNGSGEDVASTSGPSAGANTTSASPASTTTAPTTTTTTAARSVQLSSLALTLNALIALNRSRPSIAKLAFTFTLNVSARVQASLEERVGKRGHEHWKALARPFTIAGLSGRNSRRLNGHRALGAGSYRLTLTPVGGTARTIVFRIG